MTDPVAGSWRWRARVAEAMAGLTAARVLIAVLPLSGWRSWLGGLIEAERGALGSETAGLGLARAVERAADRLPFRTKCLPRAVALHWMMRRRALASELVIAVLEPQARGEGEDLHAWVESGGAIMIGALDRPFRPVARFGGRNR